ncbi:interferon-induced protein 44-like isoform X2 [Colossoma macropomum]|uniref:interferon-induced protein 44-like isoform X2 n=1 Tax=Colossoma macropomum TaxID=42526 RepID=UPI0018646193|nr:interferon-induced protein 44-like isoform X2 [Colossoma macropomum]
MSTPKTYLQLVKQSLTGTAVLPHDERLGSPLNNACNRILERKRNNGPSTPPLFCAPDDEQGHPPDHTDNRVQNTMTVGTSNASPPPLPARGQRLISERVPPVLSQVLNEPWRQVIWSEKDATLKYLEGFKPSLEVLRILLHGPTGAGKSCFINSVQRNLLGRNAIGALEQTTQSGTSFTKTIRSHKLKKRGGGRFPFILSDIMGLEPENTGGILTEDIIKVLEGHISDGYTFNPMGPITEDHPKYNHYPNLCDKVHCLVSVIPADNISRMSDKVIHKMWTIRQKAAEMNIPQVTVLTKVDIACKVVNGDLKKVYYSKKIKEKVQECSIKIGLPLNCIYPVKNYHAEITQDANIDALILMALRDIVNFANDYVEDLEE